MGLIRHYSMQKINATKQIKTVHKYDRHSIQNAKFRQSNQQKRISKRKIIVRRKGIGRATKFDAVFDIIITDRVEVNVQRRETADQVHTRQHPEKNTDGAAP